MPANELLEDLFAPLGGVSLRRMFGGLGVFKEGLMFALVAADVLYFKGDETTSPKFAAEGFGQWVYPGRDRPVPMPYWQAPDRLFDEPDDFAEWAIAAFDVAKRTQKPKARKKVAATKPAKAKPKPRQKRKTAPKRR